MEREDDIFSFTVMTRNDEFASAVRIYGVRAVSSTTLSRYTTACEMAARVEQYPADVPVRQ